MRSRKVLAVSENNCVAVNMDNPRIACLEISRKDHEVELAIMQKRNSKKR